MGIFAIEIFLLEFPFRRRYRLIKFEISAVTYKLNLTNRFSDVIDTAEILHIIIIAVSALSLTPQKFFQRCQWPCGNRFIRVIDTAEIRQQNLLLFTSCWNFLLCYRSDFSSVNGTAEIILAVSLTQKWLSQLGVWFQRCHCLSNILANTKPYVKRF
jgi:hypothetical protein